jgi:hypothetical protein
MMPFLCLRNPDHKRKTYNLWLCLKECLCDEDRLVGQRKHSTKKLKTSNLEGEESVLLQIKPVMGVVS